VVEQRTVNPQVGGSNPPLKEKKRKEKKRKEKKRKEKKRKDRCGEMVDAPDLGSGVERRVGSSPTICIVYVHKT
jgi:hypothetical protein